MAYRLKSESFEIVDGPDAGKKFKRGQVYDQIPEAYLSEFEMIPARDMPAPAKSDKKREDK